MQQLKLKTHAWILTSLYPQFRDNPEGNAHLIAPMDCGPNVEGWPKPTYTYVGPMQGTFDFDPRQSDVQAVQAIDAALTKLDSEYAAKRHDLWQQKQELLALTLNGGDNDPA